MSKNFWKMRWENKAYRKSFIFYILLAIAMIIAMPFGFDFIESRGGHHWNDFVLSHLPAYDLSVPIFVVMYSLAILFLIRVIQDPHLLYLFLKSYILITITRFVFIYFIPLDPPLTMVELVDPITKIFYGGKIITRDLFFSGHTSTMFLIFLILEKKLDKILALSVTLFIAIALIFQHIHYTADVVVAFPITWLIWKVNHKNNFLKKSV
jgi:PAP2 superfamily C-terminal